MDTPATDAKLTVLTVRLPTDIAEKLRRLAKAHDRSLNGEIVRVLRVCDESRQATEQERKV